MKAPSFALALALVCCPTSYAQSQSAAPIKFDSPPTFEITSVKRDSDPATMVQLGGSDIGRFVARNVTAKDLIEFSYDMREFQFSGGPAWIKTEKFDVDGKVEDSLAQHLRSLPQTKQQDQLRAMVQALLVDRFKLEVNRETKQMPVFALLVAKDGPKLKAVDAPDPQTSAPFPGPPTASSPGVPAGQVLLSLFANGRAALVGTAVPISKLAGALSLQVGRHVDDQTGLKSTYDFQLFYSLEGLEGGVTVRGPDGATPNSGEPSLFTAIQEQLGLKLESSRGPVDTIVVQHIEEPSAN